MKRLALAALVVLGTCASLPAQQPLSLFSAASAPPFVSANAAASSFNFDLVPSLALSNAAFPSSVPQPALPGTPPSPQGSATDEFGYHWDLAVGYEYVHFDSKAFYANLSGLHTDLTYNVYSWLGLEGNVVAAFGGDIFQSGEQSRYVLYAGGARVNWGGFKSRFTPWGHALVGGVHVNPQTALGGKNSYAVQLGGGVDWRYNPRLSIRGEADYVRTGLYSDSQNNFQVGAGVVIHF